MTVNLDACWILFIVLWIWMKVCVFLTENPMTVLVLLCLTKAKAKVKKITSVLGLFAETADIFKSRSLIVAHIILLICGNIDRYSYNTANQGNISICKYKSYIHYICRCHIYVRCHSQTSFSCLLGFLGDVRCLLSCVWICWSHNLGLSASIPIDLVFLLIKYTWEVHPHIMYEWP